MLKKSIVLAALSCTSFAWGSQVTTDLSTEYITKVTSHLDSLKAQTDKIEAAEAAASSARGEVRTATSRVESVQKDLDEANDNTSAYPRRIKRDNESIGSKQSESRRIFRDSFPEFSTPDEAISSVNRSKNRILDEKAAQERRLQRRRDEFSIPLSRARLNVEEKKTALDQNQARLAEVNPQISQAQEDARKAQKEFKEAQALKNDPRLPQKIKQAERKFAEADQARKDADTSCNGLSGITKSVCRKYKRARDEVRSLRNAQTRDLRPLKQKATRAQNKIEDLRKRKRNLESKTEELRQALRRSRRRSEDLQEELKTATRPIRSLIADLDDQLARLDSKIAKANKLESLENEIGSLQRRVVRNEEKLAALPALITKLQDDLAVVSQELESANEVSAKLAGALTAAQAVLPNQRKEINELRAEMNNSLSTVVSLAPATEEVPNADSVILESGDWDVVTTDLDNEWNRASCRAETIEVLEETDDVVTSSAKLQVVNLVNPTTGFNEPMVVMTINSTREDLVNFNTVTVRASSSKSYTFDLIYSKSSANKLFFMADLKDRKGLIKFMLDKSRMKVKLSSLGSDSNEEIEFSLKGSTKALNSRSTDESMRNSCGGIKVTDI